MRLRMTLVCLALAANSGVATAQMAMSANSGPAAGTIAAPSKAVDSQLSLIEMEMMGAVKAMPAEKFGFAPSTAIFVPGQATEFATVRTFAQQATHVASANYFFYMTVSGMKPDVDVAGFAKLTKKEDVVAALAGSFAFAHKAVATLTAANAFEVITIPEPGFYTRATLAEFGVSHAYDHYGQMVEYLRMNGIVPPASAPSK
jgi:DinB superfamily